MGMTPRQAMAIGTAGYTAMLCVLELERLGVDQGARAKCSSPAPRAASAAWRSRSSPGAAIASWLRPGRSSEADYLRRLGAAEIIDRKTLSEPGKPLQKERWAARGRFRRQPHARQRLRADPVRRRRSPPAASRRAWTCRRRVAPFILRGVTLARHQQRLRAARAAREGLGAPRARARSGAARSDDDRDRARRGDRARARRARGQGPRADRRRRESLDAKAAVRRASAPVEAPKPSKPAKPPRPDLDKTLTTAQGFYASSVQNPPAFWMRQANLIEWWKKPVEALDYSKPPFRKWFVGGETNLCFNAVDRHLIVAAEPAGARVDFDRSRRQAHLHLCAARRRGESLRRDPRSRSAWARATASSSTCR